MPGTAKRVGERERREWRGGSVGQLLTAKPRTTPGSRAKRAPWLRNQRAPGGLICVTWSASGAAQLRSQRAPESLLRQRSRRRGARTGRRRIRLRRGWRRQKCRRKRPQRAANGRLHAFHEVSKRRGLRGELAQGVAAGGGHGCTRPAKN